MPGTQLYERLRLEGRLIYDRWWLASEFRYGQAVFHPRRMTAQELTDGCFRARREFNRYRSIFRRAWDWRTNCRGPESIGWLRVGELDLASRDLPETGHWPSGATARSCRRRPVKVTLIKPNIGRLEHSLYVDSGRMEPLPLGVLAALTPPDVDVVLYDDRMESIPYDEPTDLAAITVETFTARRAYEIADEFRRRGVPRDSWVGCIRRCCPKRRPNTPTAFIWATPKHFGSR